MNLKPLANLVTNKFGRQILQVQKHSPTILFGLGIVGVIGTAVLASRATLKLGEVIDDAQADLNTAKTLEHKDYSERDRQQDIVVIYTKTTLKIAGMYAPAVAVGALSIAALTGSHIILTRRNVGLAAAYAGLDKAFRIYRERVLEDVGVEKERQYRYGPIAVVDEVEETEAGPVTKTIMVPGNPSIYTRCFAQGTSPSWEPRPEKNQFFIQCQQNYANILLRSRGHVFLNEVYDMLGLPRSKEGAVVGWIYEGGRGDGYIDFGVFEGDRHEGMRFVLGHSDEVWLDFNVDGIIYDKI